MFIYRMFEAPSRRLREWLNRNGAKATRAIKAGDYELRSDGLHVLANRVISGVACRIRSGGLIRQDWEFTPNLITDQGRSAALNTLFHSGTVKPAGWYFGVHVGSTAPTAGLTAANYASTMNELVSTSEGYTEASRQAFTVASATANGTVNNHANVATITIATVTQVSITGFGILSSDVRGGTSGLCWAGLNFPNAKQVDNDEEVDLKYQTTLLDDGV